MITIIFGTRPEAIKLGPVANELRNLQVPFRVICTGQHDLLLKGTPADTDLQPDILVDWNRGDSPHLRIAEHISPDDIVVVQGDTHSALSGAYAAGVKNARIAHVEAGVRSGDLNNPFPEEGYRRKISEIATYHFAPTHNCAANLGDEDIFDNVWVTGNPIVSAMSRYATLRVEDPQPYIIVTMHRREFLNRGKEHIQAVWSAAQSWTDSQLAIRLVWLVHPSLRPMVETLMARGNFRPMASVPYTPFQKLLRSALGVITDSGGLVEEAITLGIPTACLRVVHDRQEAEETGIFARFDPTPEGFRAGADFVMSKKKEERIGRKTFGDVGSALRIAQKLRAILKPKVYHPHSKPYICLECGTERYPENAVSCRRCGKAYPPQSAEKHGKTPIPGENSNW